MKLNLIETTILLRYCYDKLLFESPTTTTHHHFIYFVRSVEAVEESYLQFGSNFFASL